MLHAPACVTCSARRGPDSPSSHSYLHHSKPSAVMMSALSGCPPWPFEAHTSARVRPSRNSNSCASASDGAALPSLTLPRLFSPRRLLPPRRFPAVADAVSAVCGCSAPRGRGGGSRHSSARFTSSPAAAAASERQDSAGFARNHVESKSRSRSSKFSITRITPWRSSSQACPVSAA